MSLKDAFSGLKEELGKDLQSKTEKVSINIGDDESNSISDEKELPKTEATNAQRVKQQSTLGNEASLNTDISTPRKRKVGKRSDPNFTQAPAFIRKTTHQQVKINLITDADFNDYSELVEALLVQWLEQKNKAN